MRLLQNTRAWLRITGAAGSFVPDLQGDGATDVTCRIWKPSKVGTELQLDMGRGGFLASSFAIQFLQFSGPREIW